MTWCSGLIQNETKETLMSDDKARRTQQMVPDPDRIIEHGQKPTVFEEPPKPPRHSPNGGVGNANTSSEPDS